MEMARRWMYRAYSNWYIGMEKAVFDLMPFCIKQTNQKVFLAWKEG